MPAIEIPKGCEQFDWPKYQTGKYVAVTRTGLIVECEFSKAASAGIYPIEYRVHQDWFSATAEGQFLNGRRSVYDVFLYPMNRPPDRVDIEKPKWVKEWQKENPNSN